MRLALLVLVPCLLGLPDGKAVAASCTSEQLPKSAQELLHSRLSAWRVVTVQDLDPDDRKSWTAANGDSCPGIVQGSFENGKAGYAVALITSTGAELRQTVVVLTENGGTYSLSTVEAPSVTARPMVLYKLPPGSYTSAEGDEQVAARFDVVEAEAIEAGAIIYYWAEGSFKELLVSE